MLQKILTGKDQYEELKKWISGKKVLVVCGSSYPYMRKTRGIVDLHKDIVFFHHFKPNPVYESVVEGVELFNKEDCNAVMAVGGGSAIDVAKCIKLFYQMNPKESFLTQRIEDNAIPLLVVPTTAGTGSEATKYAVIYLNGEKQSITSDYCIPGVVLLDPDNLKSLPIYQRKATMMDALAHSLESMWSINSTSESLGYSKQALELIRDNMTGYLNNSDEGNAGMLMAAHIAGKAINITQTTAGHAMCYKITSLFGCAHGHAAMMCNCELLPWMFENMDKCIDTRGRKHLEKVLSEIALSLNVKTVEQAITLIKDYYASLELFTPNASDEEINDMSESVNIQRLKNNPINMTVEDIKMLYKRIFIGKLSL